MYPVLAERIDGYECRKAGARAPKGLRVWDVFRMATSGAMIPINTALRIRDLYFPGESLEELFSQYDDANILTAAEAVNIMRHTRPLENMPELVEAVFSHTRHEVENLPDQKGVIFAIGWALAIGRAAGVREERARTDAATLHEVERHAV